MRSNDLYLENPSILKARLTTHADLLSRLAYTRISVTYTHLHTQTFCTVKRWQENQRMKTTIPIHTFIHHNHGSMKKEKRNKQPHKLQQKRLTWGKAGSAAGDCEVTWLATVDGVGMTSLLFSSPRNQRSVSSSKTISTITKLSQTDRASAAHTIRWGHL